MREGSIVICIDNEGIESFLTKDKEYVIEEYYGDDIAFINVKENSGRKFDFVKSRFKLKKEAIKEEVW